MAKNVYVGISGKARKVKKMYVGIGGKARKVKKAYIGVGGKARLFWNGGTVPFSYAGEIQTLPEEVYGRSLSLDNHIICTSIRYSGSIRDDDIMTGAFDKNFAFHSIRINNGARIDEGSPYTIIGGRAIFPDTRRSNTGNCTAYVYDDNLVQTTFSMKSFYDGYAESIADGSVGYFAYGQPGGSNEDYTNYVLPIDANLVAGSSIYPTTCTWAVQDGLGTCGTYQYVVFAGERSFSGYRTDMYFLAVDSNRVIVHDARDFIPGQCYSMETIDRKNMYGYTVGSYNVGGAFKISENLVLTQLTWGDQWNAPDDFGLTHAFGATDSHIFSVDSHYDDYYFVSIDENLVSEQYEYASPISANTIINYMVVAWRAQDKAMQIYRDIRQDQQDDEYNARYATFNIYNG